MKRVFFAVLPPPAALNEVVATIATMRRRAASDGIRWSSREQVHFTLKFLGEQPDERVEEALAAARETARRQRPFELGLGAPGAFPSRERPRILWVGAAEGAGPLTDLANALDAALGARGFLREDRPFVPHATIARVRSRDGERAAARGLATFAAPAIASTAPPSPERVSSFVLMRSETARDGARYTVVEELPLAQLG